MFLIHSKHPRLNQVPLQGEWTRPQEEISLSRGRHEAGLPAVSVEVTGFGVWLPQQPGRSVELGYVISRAAWVQCRLVDLARELVTRRHHPSTVIQGELQEAMPQILAASLQKRVALRWMVGFLTKMICLMILCSHNFPYIFGLKQTYCKPI